MINESINFLYYLPFIFGLCWGSFLKLCIDRLPRNKSIIFPNSECFQCNKPLLFFDKIPIISWVILKRRCRFCNVIIPSSYPLVELFVGCLIALVFYIFSNPITIIVYCIFFSLLIIGSGIDLKELWIPDFVSLGGILLGLILSYFIPSLHGSDISEIGLLHSFKGLVTGSGILFTIGYFAKLILKQDAMGMGDIKLLGAIGAFIGWKGVIFCIFFASLIALIISILLVFLKKKSLRDQIPFGPYLSIASILYILLEIQIHNIFTQSLFLY